MTTVLTTRLGKIGLSLIILTLCACEPPPQQQMPPPAVQVESVSEKPVETGLEFVGRTEAVEDVSIRPRVEGYLLDLHFTEGDVVDKGQLLFNIDPHPYLAAAAQAKAEVARTHAELTVARKNYQRGEKLLPQGTISEADFEELKGQFEASKANVEAAEASLEAAELNLDYTQIDAPITGRIGRKSLSIGDLATPSDVLVTLVQQDPTYVSFQVNEKDMINAMEASREAGRDTKTLPKLVPYITLANGSEYPLPGQLNFLDNRVDPATGTVTVRTEFANPDGLLIPGQYVVVTVRDENPRTAIVIPQRAVQEDQLGRFVLVVDDDNIANIRRLSLGSRIKTDWAVDSGLEVGERIIVDGIQKVRIGQPVAPREASGPAAGEE